MTEHQRELVKFFRSYVLSLEKKKRLIRELSEVAPSMATSIMHPADESLYQFMPDKDPVDKKIYENIIEP